MSIPFINRLIHSIYDARIQIIDYATGFHLFNLHVAFACSKYHLLHGIWQHPHNYASERYRNRVCVCVPGNFLEREKKWVGALDFIAVLLRRDSSSKFRIWASNRTREKQIQIKQQRIRKKWKKKRSDETKFEESTSKVCAFVLIAHQHLRTICYSIDQLCAQLRREKTSKKECAHKYIAQWHKSVNNFWWFYFSSLICLPYPFKRNTHNDLIYKKCTANKNKSRFLLSLSMDERFVFFTSYTWTGRSNRRLPPNLLLISRFAILFHMSTILNGFLFGMCFAIWFSGWCKFSFSQ